MSTFLGPVITRPYRGPLCTACGREMTAVIAAFKGRADAVLCCDGCGRRGVHCECSPVDGYHGIRRKES